MTAVMRGRGSAGQPMAAIIGGFITTVIILLYIARVPHNHTAPKSTPLFQRLDLVLLWAPCSIAYRWLHYNNYNYCCRCGQL